MDNQTPETIRTAAYLAARERLDARKTTRNVQCNPPNVRCGNRCIPPSWDCRLKGQGTDPHLRAVKTDPLGGLANIQRGFGRISRGIVRGNFSEVEGGKRAIIRGTVKITPGNIQQKKELQKKLENRTRAIGVGLAVVTGGLGIHALLMKSNTFGYRDGVGADINRSVRLGVSKILDATPVIGANRARVRAQVASGISAELGRQSNPVSAELTNQLSRTKPSAADEDSRSNLIRRLTEIDEDLKYRGPNSSFSDWDRAHQAAFWSTTKVDKNYGESSIFARPATDEFLARQFNLQGDDALTSLAIKDAVVRNLTTYKNDLTDLAQQQGFKVDKTSTGGRTIAKNDRRAFIQGLVSSTLPRGESNDRVRSALTTHLEQTLSQSPSTRANDIYKKTFDEFNKFYTEKATAIENATARPRLTKQMRETGAGQTLLDARQARASLVAGKEIKGPSHAELALRQYHAQAVQGTPRSMFIVTDRLASAAASEIEGRSVGPAEAFRVLEREGITGAVPQRSQATRAPRPLTEGEAVYNLMRENPGMTLQAARREIKRRRGDEDDFSPELVRTATYLAARADFQEGKRLGKPCGASHIPKAHECRKGQGAPATEASSESGKPSRLGQKIALAAVVTAVGAVGVTVALDAHRFYNAKDLPNPPGYREAIRGAQAGDPKVGYDVAIGRHYDKVVSEQGWKPGQLVYTRYGSGSDKKDPTGHFAVYMGKNGDRHQFADFGVRSSSAREGEVNLYEYGPGSKGVAPFVFVKAPPLKRGTEPLSSEQIQQRVFSSLGARMKYDALDNNCETWARMITTGQARSAQVERLSVLTRGIYRFYDRKTAGALPKDIPSVKQQARILDMQARAASGDKSARADLKAFQALIKQGKRTDGMQKDTESELPTPAQLLSAATSDVDALIRTKLYLMLLIRQGEARAYGPA